MRVAAIELVLIAETLIDTGTGGPASLRLGDRAKPVVGYVRVHVWQSWQRRHTEQELGQRIFQTGWNPIVGEGLAGPGVGIGGKGVVNERLLASAIYQAAHVAVAHRLRRRLESQSGRTNILEVLPGKKPEGLVLAVIELGDDHRAADAHAEFIAI